MIGPVRPQERRPPNRNELAGLDFHFAGHIGPGRRNLGLTQLSKSDTLIVLDVLRVIEVSL